MDYTLALYNDYTFDRLTYKLMVEGLLKKGYPGQIGELPYDDSFVVRGLLIDLVKGNLVQLDRSANVLVQGGLPSFQLTVLGGVPWKEENQEGRHSCLVPFHEN